MKRLRPFFSFYGAKWRLAPRYPTPTYDTIVEPFAGAANYSVFHHDKRVILVEKDARIAALWRYLISVDEVEVLSLPDIKAGQRTTDMDLSPEQRTLIGYWVVNGAATPQITPTSWMVRPDMGPCQFWGPCIRARIASQLPAIRHWTVIHGDYTEAPDITGTWFVDPPYTKGGEHYRESSRRIDYSALGNWCRQRRGQVIVCESEGAKWLPFEPFAMQPGTYKRRTTKEVVGLLHNGTIMRGHKPA